MNKTWNGNTPDCSVLELIENMKWTYEPVQLKPNLTDENPIVKIWEASKTDKRENHISIASRKKKEI